MKGEHLKVEEALRASSPVEAAAAKDAAEIEQEMKAIETGRISPDVNMPFNAENTLVKADGRKQETKRWKLFKQCRCDPT